MTLVDLPNDEDLLIGQTKSVDELWRSRRLAIVYDPDEPIGSQLRFNLWLKSSDEDFQGKTESLPSVLRNQVFYSQSEYGYMFVLLQPNGTASAEMLEWLKSEELAISNRNNAVKGPYIYAMPTSAQKQTLPILKRVQLQSVKFKNSEQCAFLNREFPSLGWISFWLPDAVATESDLEKYKMWDRDDSARYYVANATETSQFLERKELAANFSRAHANFFLLGMQLEKVKRSRFFFLPAGTPTAWRELLERKYGLKFTTSRPVTEAVSVSPQKKRKAKILERYRKKQKKVQERKLDAKASAFVSGFEKDEPEVEPECTGGK